MEQDGDHRAEILSGSKPTDQPLGCGRSFGEGQSNVDYAPALRPVLDREPGAAQDGSGQRVLAVLMLAFGPVKRAIPVSGCGPQGRPHFAHPGSRGEGAEEQRPSCAPFRRSRARG